MRLVVDTNVFVSAALKDSSWPGETIRWLARFGGLLKSEATEREVIAVLQRPRILPKIAPLYLKNIGLLFASAEMVAIIEAVVECRDPRDDMFLELAVNGRADVIISGDADLLAMDDFQGIPIITPAAFCQVRAM